MPESRTFVAGATLLVLLTAAACSGGGDDAPEGAERLNAEAKWSAVDLPAEKLNRGAAVELDSALPPGPGGPYLVVGTTTEPGAAAKVTAYTSADGTGLVTSASALDVGGDPSVGGAVADGNRTLVYGTSWQDGRSRSWIRGTTDRKSWSEIAVPAGLAKGGAVVSEVVPLEGEDALALGRGSKHTLLAQRLEGGDLVTLPAAPDKATYAGVQASARNGDTIVVLATAESEDGTNILVGLRSTDGGGTWSLEQAPEGESPLVSGLVVAKDGFVATGWTGAAVAQPTVWSSADGSAWKRELLPELPTSSGNWSAWLGQPRAHAGRVYTSLNHEQWLSGQVLVREAKRWRVLGSYGNTTSPGVEAIVAPGDRGVVVARSHHGQASFGLLDGQFGSVSRTGTSDFTGSWDAPAAGSAAPALAYSRTVVTLEPDNGWSRATATQHLGFQDEDTVAVTGLQPPQARRLTGTQTVSAPDGATVLLGDDTHVNDGAGNGDDTDVAGFFRPKGGQWQPVKGLSGPRTELLGKVARVGDQWVAIGSDRRDFSAAEHEFGAVWTSSNGVDWKRATGRFDVDPAYDSWVSDVCLSPQGAPMVVGGNEDQDRGSEPRAWQQTGGTWRPLDINGLGKGISSVSGCVGTGKVTLLQGEALTGSKVWRTSDLKTFEPVTVAGEDNSFGTLRQVTGGFAAAGYLGEGTKSQAVLWLSRNGEDWTPVDVPGDRQLSASDVVQWGKRLIVLLDSAGGPAISSLDNFDEVLAEVE